MAKTFIFVEVLEVVKVVDELVEDGSDAVASCDMLAFKPLRWSDPHGATF